MLTNRVEALMRLRELVLNRTEIVSEAARIDERVQSLEEQAEYAGSDQFPEILREIDRSRLRLEKLAFQAGAARPELHNQMNFIFNQQLMLFPQT